MSTQELQVDNDFASLIPPLNDDEYCRLEQSILHEGCRDAIIVWNNVIIDGHHRYKICKAHNIDFHTIQMEFSSKDDVILWMIQNQLGRRNLSDLQRVEIVRKYEEAVKAQAEQRMLAGKADPIGAWPAIYVSFGGVKSDENFRVIRKDGTPIKGLYAAGEVLGSLEAQEGRAYTSGLLQGMVTGKIAADSAVSDMN